MRQNVGFEFLGVIVSRCNLRCPCSTSIRSFTVMCIYDYAVFDLSGWNGLSVTTLSVSAKFWRTNVTDTLGPLLDISCTPFSVVHIARTNFSQVHFNTIPFTILYFRKGLAGDFQFRIAAVVCYVFRLLSWQCLIQIIRLDDWSANMTHAPGVDKIVTWSQMIQM